MARPIKEGLDYFPLNVDIDQDDKVAIVEAEHGMLGFAIVIKLLMKIYSEGYYYDWTEKEQILFSKRVNVDINEVNDVINSCVKWGLFDEKLFKEYKLLTSAGIQRRYLEITKRRKKVEMANQHLLLHDDDINSYTNIVYVDINSQGEIIDDDINPQSKVKQSKVKQSKVKQSKVKQSSGTTTEEDKKEPVAQVDADSTKQEKALRKIENYYLQKVRQKATSSGTDLSNMVEAYEKYGDVDFILSVMKDATRQNIERNGKCRINSFRYFMPIFEERWELKGARDNEPTTRSNKQDNGEDEIDWAKRAGIQSF